MTLLDEKLDGMKKKTRDNRLVIAVDFDGTLFETDYPTIIGPINKVIDFCKKRQADGDLIILWTCREGKLLQEAIDACKEQNLIFDAVNENIEYRIKRYRNDCRKVGADIYIDDRAIDMSYFK